LKRDKSASRRMNALRLIESSHNSTFSNQTQTAGHDPYVYRTINNHNILESK